MEKTLDIKFLPCFCRYRIALPILYIKYIYKDIFISIPQVQLYLYIGYMWKQNNKKLLGVTCGQCKKLLYCIPFPIISKFLTQILYNVNCQMDFKVFFFHDWKICVPNWFQFVGLEWFYFNTNSRTCRNHLETQFSILNICIKFSNLLYIL